MNKLGFRSLLVWQRSRDLAVTVYTVTSEDPIAHDYHLVGQIRRSAVSVASNIAEGDERDTNKEAIRFFYIAKGSLAELITQLDIAYQVGYIPFDAWHKLDTECISIANMLGALIKIRRSRT